MVDSQTVLRRINLALKNLVDMVFHKDLELLYGIVTDYLHGYDVHYGHVVDRFHVVMGEILMLPAEGNESRRMKTYKAKPSIRSRANVLVSLLETLSFTDSKDRGERSKFIPRRLVIDLLRFSKCQIFQSNMTDIFQTKVLRNGYDRLYEHRDTILLSKSDTEELYELYKMHTLNKCVNELQSQLESIVRAKDKANTNILQIYELSPKFENAQYLETEREHLYKLEATATWLLEQITAYSGNRTTKIELSKSISGSILSNIQITIDRIVSVVERKIINTLLSMTNDISSTLMQLYSKSLGVFSALVPIYDDTDIEDRLRTMKIWRYPVARLETADILQFKYRASESWISWEMDTTLEEFVAGGHATEATSSKIELYRDILKSELLQIRTKCKHARHDVIRAIKDVIDDFTNVHIESLMGRDFVQ